MLDGIELASTDELLEELQKRFDHSVFAGSKEVDGHYDATDMRWCGNMLSCSGLTQCANHKIMQMFDETRRVADDEGTEIDAD